MGAKTYSHHCIESFGHSCLCRQSCGNAFIFIT